MLSLNCSEIITYKKIIFELKNVHNVLGILLKTILKIINSRFYENVCSKIFRMLPVFDKLFRFFLLEREYFIHFPENIKCGNLKKNRVIYHNELKGVTI